METSLIGIDQSMKKLHLFSSLFSLSLVLKQGRQRSIVEKLSLQIWRKKQDLTDLSLKIVGFVQQISFSRKYKNWVMCFLFLIYLFWGCAQLLRSSRFGWYCTVVCVISLQLTLLSRLGRNWERTKENTGFQVTEKGANISLKTSPKARQDRPVLVCPGFRRF